MKTKKLTRIEIKNADTGQVKAVFSTLAPSIEAATAAQIDSDGDVTLKGAFTNGQQVVISAYGHKSWEGALPYGTGTISEVGNEAIFEGQFLLDTTHGADAFATIKALSEAGLQEWSYSLHDVVADRAVVDGKSVRVLKKINVKEVSPVLKGAGVNTRTLDVKADTKQLQSSLARLLSAAGRDRWQVRYSTWTWLEDYDPDEGFAVFGIESDGTSRLVQVAFDRTDTSVALGADEVEVHETAVFLPKARRMKFSEHVGAVVAAADELTTRASEVVALRAEKGKTIAPESADLLKQVEGRLDRLKALLVEPATAPPPADDDAVKEYLRFVGISQGVIPR